MSELVGYDKKKAARWVAGAPSEVLRRIIDETDKNDRQVPTPEYPLAGMSHVEGVGRVPNRLMREELEKRSVVELHPRSCKV